MSDAILNFTINPVNSGSLHVFINHVDRGIFNQANFNLLINIGDYFEMYADPVSGYTFNKYIQPNGQETYDSGFATYITHAGTDNIVVYFVSANKKSSINWVVPVGLLGLLGLAYLLNKKK